MLSLFVLSSSILIIPPSKSNHGTPFVTCWHYRHHFIKLQMKCLFLQLLNWPIASNRSRDWQHDGNEINLHVLLGVYTRALRNGYQSTQKLDTAGTNTQGTRIVIVEEGEGSAGGGSGTWQTNNKRTVAIKTKVLYLERKANKSPARKDEKQNRSRPKLTWWSILWVH